MDSKHSKSVPIHSSEITPEEVYLNRRQFMKLAGMALGGALLAACTPRETPTAAPIATATAQPTASPTALKTQSVVTKPQDELGDAYTSYDDITHFNNFYEFSESKEYVSKIAQKLTTTPWQVEVGGLVNNPKTYDLDDLLKRFTQQERVYRLRCVEGWSMVIPWVGFPLNQLLAEVEPQSSARFVRFVSLNRPEEMQGQKNPLYPWPYQEGLRLDEAMNDLTLLATGLYGKPLPNQDGAPIRLAVPWKYGFKSSKSIVKIELVDSMPATFWSEIAPREYGFYSNVNPNHPHPRWSQATERRIGELSRRDTLMFNGYTEQVASLYSGMDLNLDY